MRLPRTETTLAAVLLLAAAPFALAIPPGATPGVTPPEQTPNTTNPSATNPGATNPSTMAPQETSPGSAQSGTANPSAATAPGTTPPRGQDLQNGRSGSSMSSSGWSHNRAHSRSAERVPQADIDAARSAKVSLTDAINTAEQQHHGKVVSARFELRQGKPEYLIRAFNTNRQQLWIGHIDANSGQLIGHGETIPLSRVPKAEEPELTASQREGTSLAQAVRTAERQDGGKVLSAGLSTHDGQVSYRTELLKSNGRTQMAMINPRSGQVSQYR